MVFVSWDIKYSGGKKEVHIRFSRPRPPIPGIVVRTPEESDRRVGIDIVSGAERPLGRTVDVEKRYVEARGCSFVFGKEGGAGFAVYI